ncbi:hypothetical protein [Amycolatopsis nalaikhensis]|uniref:Uncharacterized protein n=1 Tax=Amycolatopsis nalaikhensis TaxID=715472 RepID=A0ABY8XIH0_9PSEU|nr:hypothetical protein [Amycolatopsis sp. 2-2]WIV55391.1 hypothetical protein QP939_42320 [Amycolatopsis sp. 2-2]
MTLPVVAPETFLHPVELGWPVITVPGRVGLATVSGFCGVEVAGALATRVLDRLRATESDGPVVGIPGPPPHRVFIAEADVVADPAEFARYGGRLLHAPHRITLPPSGLPYGPAVWLVPPRPARRWLPSLSTILWALRAAEPRGTERAVPPCRLGCAF